VISYLKRAPSVTVIVVLVLSAFIVNINLSKWNRKEIVEWDITSYYAYLPATFIKKDLSLKFVNGNEQHYFFNHQFVPLKAPNGGNVIKTTMGMSVMYLPFFATAHLYANVFGYETDGFSEPYQCMLQFSGLIYLVIGLFFLRKILLLYLPEKVTAFTLLCVVFGSNLFYYASVHGAMSHSHSFCLGSIYIWYSIKWLERPVFRTSLIIGLVFGLMVLIRPVNLVLVVFMVLFKVTSWEGLKQRLMFFWNNKGLVLLMKLTVILCLMPQLLYWKWITGQYFFNSYIGERFYWGQPHLLEGLFGFRKGWLLYSPVMICSVIGMLLSFKDRKEFGWSTMGLFCIYCYLIFSWWCWWYGGSYGMRAMIDIYPFLSIAFAVFVNRYWSNKIIVSALTILVLWNCFRMFQYRRGVIHFDGMNREAFVKGFFKTERTPELEKYFKSPDYETAIKGEEKYD
jgi:hypothetical protein